MVSITFEKTSRPILRGKEQSAGPHTHDTQRDLYIPSNSILLAGSPPLKRSKVAQALLNILFVGFTAVGVLVAGFILLFVNLS